jgi:hypothetical protein
MRVCMSYTAEPTTSYLDIAEKAEVRLSSFTPSFAHECPTSCIYGLTQHGTILLL